MDNSHSPTEKGILLPHILGHSLSWTGIWVVLHMEVLHCCFGDVYLRIFSCPFSLAWEQNLCLLSALQPVLPRPRLLVWRFLTPLEFESLVDGAVGIEESKVTRVGKSQKCS